MPFDAKRPPSRGLPGVRPLKAVAIALTVFAFTASPALGQTQRPDALPDAENERIDRFTVELIGDMLDTLGLSYSVGLGPYGEPAMTVDGSRDAAATRAVIDGFEVRFFGCDANGRCDEMSLVSHYRPDRPTSLSTVNRFNQSTRFTTAYTGIEGDLVLSMDLSAVGGIGRQATMIMIAIYVYNMESFAQAIG